MTPLDDARELFGADALSDRKQLRRAYARLVKAHPPDADAAMFQRVRAAFEAAKEALENPDAATPDIDEALAALMDGLTEERFETDLQQLEAWAHDRRDAALAALFLVQATRPADVLQWIANLRQRGLPDDALLTLLTALLEMRPDQGLEPLCGALTMTLPPGRAATLDGHRVRAGIRQGDPTDGFELWRNRQVALRTFDASTWLHVADAILFFAAEDTPTDILDGIEGAIEDVGLEADEQAHADLVIGLRQARTLSTLKADPAIPATMVDALRRGQRTSAPGMFSALRQVREDLAVLGDGSLSEGMQVLAVLHPQAYEMLRDLEARLTGSRAFHNEWARTGEAPNRSADAVLPIFSEAVTSLSKDRIGLPQTPLLALTALGLFATCCALAVALVIVTWWLKIPVLFVGFLTGGMLRGALERPVHSFDDWLEACADIQHTYGLWRYEVIAGLTSDAVLANDDALPEGLVDALFDDTEADLRCLSAAHGFRSTLAWQPDAADSDAADSDAADSDATENDLEEQPDER